MAVLVLGRSASITGIPNLVSLSSMSAPLLDMLKNILNSSCTNRIKPAIIIIELLKDRVFLYFMSLFSCFSSSMGSIMLFHLFFKTLRFTDYHASDILMVIRQ